MRCAAAPQGSRIPWQIVQGEAPQPPAGTVYQDLAGEPAVVHLVRMELRGPVSFASTASVSPRGRVRAAF